MLSINPRVLKVKITNGFHIGDIALIPRIELTPSETSFPLRMSRKQFTAQFLFVHIKRITRIRRFLAYTI